MAAGVIQPAAVGVRRELGVFESVMMIMEPVVVMNLAGEAVI